LLKRGENVDYEDPENYYFSGLSFSTTAITGSTAVRSEKPITFFRETTKTTVNQILVSLCILEKKDDIWEIYQPAFLPKVEHGVDEDSILVDSLTVNGRLETNDDISTSGDIESTNIKTTQSATVGTDLTVGKGATVTDNITAGGSGYIKNNLEVGTSGNSSTGAISATKSISAPTISATESLDAKNVAIDGSLSVQNTSKTAEANVDKLSADAVTVVNSITVHKGAKDTPATTDPAILEADKIQVPYVNSQGTRTAYTEITGTGFSSPFARIAKIETDLDSGVVIQGKNVTAKGDIKAQNLYQTVSSVDMNVPVIDLIDQGSGYYQLQISKIGKKL
jgi:hypothetical protein